MFFQRSRLLCFYCSALLIALFTWHHPVRVVAHSHEDRISRPTDETVTLHTSPSSSHIHSTSTPSASVTLSSPSTPSSSSSSSSSSTSSPSSSSESPLVYNSTSVDPLFTHRVREFSHSLGVGVLSFLLSFTSFLLGIAELLYGLKTFKTFAFLTGFAAILAVSVTVADTLLQYILCNNPTFVLASWAPFLILFVCVLFGLLGGCMFARHRKFAAATLGGLFGIPLGACIYQTIVLFHPQVLVGRASIIYFLLVCLTSTLFITYGLVKPRLCVLICTSGLGAWLIIRSIAKWQRQWRNEFRLHQHIIQQQVQPTISPSTPTSPTSSPTTHTIYLYYLIGILILWLLGFCLQSHRRDRLPMHGSSRHHFLHYFSVPQTPREEIESKQLVQADSANYQSFNQPLNEYKQNKEITGQQPQMYALYPSYLETELDEKKVVNSSTNDAKSMTYQREPAFPTRTR